jgi:hypothetical protein
MIKVGQVRLTESKGTACQVIYARGDAKTVNWSGLQKNSDEIIVSFMSANLSMRFGLGSLATCKKRYKTTIETRRYTLEHERGSLIWTRIRLRRSSK